MIILTLRTDKPEAELGLYEDTKQVAYETWAAHRQLAEMLHTKIQAMLEKTDKTWGDVEGIVVYEGPGSFTGLRIGISAANAFAYANQAQIVGASSDEWTKVGIKKLLSGMNSKTVLPAYGSDAHITIQKK